LYGKLFESMYAGTLYGNWEAIVTLQQLVIIADESGLVDMTPPAIAAKTSIPLDIIEKGIKVLSKEDKYSRSGEHNGKRIVLVDEPRPWGWQIVNYKYYRDLASREDKKMKDRDRIAEKRKKIKGVATCRNESQMSPIHIQIQDTDTDTKNKPKREAKASLIKNSDIEIVINFLNSKTGKNFQLKNPAGKLTSNALKIKDRMKDGYTIQQCKTVIARKCNDWRDWDGAANALTPETLFRKSNFDKYIGECVIDE
jgi:uncharacterized phage protein (TIGR02220 family)